jgi:hypothetical protein
MTKKKVRLGPPVSPKVPDTREGRYELHYQEFKSRGLGDAECKRLAQEVIARENTVPPTPQGTYPALRLSAPEQEKFQRRESARLAAIPPEPELPEPRTLEEVTPEHLRQSLNAELSKVQLEGTGTVSPPEE